jgi:hypothetical protein
MPRWVSAGWCRTTGRSGCTPRAFDRGLVDLFPGVALAVAAAARPVVGGRVSEGLTAVVEVGGGAVPLLASRGRACARADTVGDPLGRIAADGVDSALASLALALLQLQVGRGDLHELLAVIVEPRCPLAPIDVDLVLEPSHFLVERLRTIGPACQRALEELAFGTPDDARKRPQPV